MNRLSSPSGPGRYWVIGGRWADGGRQLPWPRVLGPYADAASARASAERLEALGEPDAGYVVVADVPDGVAPAWAALQVSEPRHEATSF